MWVSIGGSGPFSSDGHTLCSGKTRLLAFEQHEIGEAVAGSVDCRPECVYSKSWIWWGTFTGKNSFARPRNRSSYSTETKFRRLSVSRLVLGTHSKFTNIFPGVYSHWHDSLLCPFRINAHIYGSANLALVWLGGIFLLLYVFRNACCSSLPLFWPSPPQWLIYFTSRGENRPLYRTMTRIII